MYNLASNRLYNMWFPNRREVYRYQAVLMRQRFDQNKDVKDMRIAKDLLLKGEEELFQKQHWLPRKCKNCYYQFVINNCKILIRKM